MTDEEIKQYLKDYGYKIPARNGISDILNTSRQIINYNYDFEKNTMTLITPDNTFVFDWVLNKIK